MKRTVARNPEQTIYLNKVADAFAELLDVAPENIGTTGGRIGDILCVVLPVSLAEQLLTEFETTRSLANELSTAWDALKKALRFFPDVLGSSVQQESSK